MSFEFVIPLSRDDLLRRTGVDHYAVDEVHSLRILPTKLQEAKHTFRSVGPTGILTCFDTFYSVLKQFETVPIEFREDAWELLLIALQTNATGLQRYLEGDVDPSQRLTHLNCLKMITYLVCQFIEVYESENVDPTAAAVSKGRKKTKAARARDGNIDWDVEKDRAIKGLLHVLQLSVLRLWDPPVVEDDFVSMVTNTCYKLLENPNMSKAVCKISRDTIYHLLGLMVKKYNHGLGCGLKIIQLLQHFEHLASPMAQGIEIFYNKYGIKNVPADVLREIGRMDPKDLARDTSGTRAYAAFLVEMAERVPNAVLPSISLVLGLLDGESYTMRNSVLGVLGELIIHVLSKEGLDDQQKTTRDQFLDKLEDHIHDVHAFTRSKALQIWHRIVLEKALPLPRQHTLLEIVIGRLQDKSSQVRRYALQLTTSLLRSNPFAAKLPVDELKTNYEKEKEKLESILPEKEAETTLLAAKRENRDYWNSVSEKLSTHISTYYENLKNKEDSDESEKEDLISDEDSVESVKSKIAQMLKDGALAEAVKLYFTAKELWPQNGAFVVSKQRPVDPAMSFTADDDDSLDSDQKSELVCVHMRNIYSAMFSIDMPIDDPSTEPSGIMNEFAKQQVLVQYLKDSLNFASAIQLAVPVICQLLGSKNTSDVSEAIDFFVTSFEFGVSNVMPGVRRMLVLVWSKEGSIKETVVEAYRRLYLRTEGPNPRAKALAVANNLTALTVGATMGDLTSLEELMCEFVKNEDLDKKVIQVLWERFAMKIPGTTNDDSRGAVTLLGMAAGAEMEIVRSNIDVLVKEGLGPRGETDFLLTKDVCSALLKLGASKKPKPGSIEEPFRFPADNEIFTRLSYILVEGASKLELDNWLPMAEKAVNVIYQLSEKPDQICGEIIKQIAKIVIDFQVTLPAEETSGETQTQEEGESQEAAVDEETPAADTAGETEKSDKPDESQPSTSQDADDQRSESQQSDDSTSPGLRCPAGLLTRLLFLAGHIALRQLVHLDVAVFGEMKRRHAVQEESSKSKATSVTASALKKNPKRQEEEDDELGLNGAVVEDAEAEFIRKLTEEEIVGANLLSLLKPMIVAVCNNQPKYPDPELRAAASLALAKYMMVSSQFCEKHLQLLFTILEKSPHPVIRANTIIALGDLTFRFPNLIEPWTSNLYARLRDISPTVRKNTLMVLTHLILNDMVKVKGQISELATCVVDHDSRIAGLSKLFFHELAKKGNAIYNIMPDVISRLSDPDIGVEEDNFRTIMKYLFGFIQKDRQCESLVEKLCHRFRATINERQWRDLSLCLSLLSYSEKSVRKLQENFVCYGDKLGEEEVYNSFVTILTGAKKFAKPETKVLIEEFEQRVEECHTKGMEEAEVTHKASKAAAAAKSKGRKTPSRKGRLSSGRGRSPRRSIGSDGGGDDEDFQPGRRNTAKSKKGQRKLSISSEDELFDVKEGLTEEGGVKVPSDNENINPNITGDASPELIVKKQQKSVTNAKQQETGTPRTRRTRKASVKYK